MTNKEKFQNFWYYHKYHVLLGAFILIFIVMTISECAMKRESDLGIGYVSEVYKDCEPFRQTVSEVIEDVSGDGVSNATVSSVVFSETPQADVDIMMGQKAVVLFASGDYQIYIMDKEYFSAEVCREMFIDLSSMLPDEMREDAVLRGEEITAIKTTHSAFLNDNGFSGDNIYIGISGLINDNKDSEEAKLLLQNAKEFFENYIAK